MKRIILIVLALFGAAASLLLMGCGKADTWNGIPIYPHAKQIQEMLVPLPNDIEIESGEYRYYTTSDAVSQVVSFYKAELPKYHWSACMTQVPQPPVEYSALYTKRDLIKRAEFVTYIWVSSVDEVTFFGLAFVEPEGSITIS